MSASFLEVWEEGDLRRLHALYQHAWWARERSLDETRRLVRGSSVALGLVEEPGRELVAFARALTDGVCTALVFDVVVRPDRRASGLGQAHRRAPPRTPHVARGQAGRAALPRGAAPVLRAPRLHGGRRRRVGDAAQPTSGLSV